jgi:methionyl-tRNA formyltransferase
MRIVFLGLPLAALLLSADGHQVPLAGLRRGLTAGARRLRASVPNPTVVLDPQNDWPAFEQMARALAPDLLVSWFFTRKIPVSLCQTCRLGGIGVHPSLLPRHRGPDPYFATIDAGDELTGVTVHRIEAQYDTGAIVRVTTLPVNPSWNAWQLAKALDRPALALLRSVVAAAARGEDLAGTAQQEALASCAPEPDEQVQWLNWSDPAAKIVRRVRALAPCPGALVQVGDTTILLLQASVHPAPPKALIPGEAAVVGGQAVVRAADAGVALLRGDVDGKLLGPDELAMLMARSGRK